ncbi:MAG: nucleoside triphosphate pyrophosphohydrolase [Acidobacteria bacterium]|jgi:MazG family protein|nr:nucleoside triphosphate pyrophosphohydrolase [Acidobacteriota bacterium]
MDSTDRLIAIMARLRGEGGCPWDREQTPRTLRPYVLEEAHEVAEAIDGGDWDELRDELGDLLLQVAFLSRIAEEEGRFRFDDVAAAISDKLERRHPHVFGDAQAKRVEDVWRRWDEIKRAEKAGTAEDGGPDASRLAGIPRGLPALGRAAAVADKASRAGFDWPEPAGIVDKLAEETAELRAALAAGDRDHAEEELGDLLFAAASLARRLKIDPEGALARATAKFVARFRSVEEGAAADGVRLEDLGPAELDRRWNAAKRAE